MNIQEIQSVVYSAQDNTFVRVTLNDARDIFTPVNPKNRQWRQVLAWVKAGGVIGPYVPRPPSPDRLRRMAMDEAAETQDLATRAANATNAQVDTWLLNNLTNVAQARVIVGAIIKRLIAKGLL